MEDRPLKRKMGFCLRRKPSRSHSLQDGRNRKGKPALIPQPAYLGTAVDKSLSLYIISFAPVGPSSSKGDRADSITHSGKREKLPQRLREMSG